MEKVAFYQAILKLSTTKPLNMISVRDISHELGISTGALYYQFKNKRDLLNQMFIHYKQELEQFIDSLSGSKQDILSSYLEYCQSHLPEYNFFLSSELVNSLQQESIEYSATVHRKILNKLEIDFDNQNYLNAIVMGTIRSMLTAPSYFSCKHDSEQIIDVLIDVIDQHQNRDKA